MRSDLRSCTFLAVLALAGCSSGSSTSDGSAGSVAVALTVAPIGSNVLYVLPDNASVAHVDVSLKSIDLHIVPSDASGPADDIADDDDDPGAWHSLTLPAPATIDLMTLVKGLPYSLGRFSVVPAGKITQIRLVLDKDGPHDVVLADGAKCSLDLSHVPATGVKIVHPFAPIAVDGQSPIQVVLDLDVVHSIREAARCAYVLDPVIRFDRVDADDDSNGPQHMDMDEQGHDQGEH